MSLIRSEAVAPFRSPIVGMNRGTTSSADRRNPEIADAMRPGVIRKNTHPAAHPFLRGEKQSVVVSRSPVVEYCNASVILPLLCILQKEASPLIRISGGGAGCIVHPVDRARTEAEKYGRIQLIAGAKVSCTTSHIIRCQQPISPKLSLDAEIPLVDRGRFGMERVGAESPELGKHHVLLDGNRKRISAGIRGPRI